MKNQRKLVAGLVVGAAVTGAAVAGAVTLSNAPKTPCTFGAMANSVTCGSEKSAPMSKIAPIVASEPASNLGAVKPTAQQSVQVSTIFEETAQTQVASSGTKPQLSAVPLPVAGSLLAGSFGLMFAAGRSRKRARR